MKRIKDILWYAKDILMDVAELGNRFMTEMWDFCRYMLVTIADDGEHGCMMLLELVLAVVLIPFCAIVVAWETSSLKERLFANVM